MWEKDPDQYSSGISNSAFVLMERTFASPDDRLRSLIAREKLMPAALQAAHQNLKNPPRIYTEIALEQLPDIITFFQSDVPAAFKQAQDEQLKQSLLRRTAPSSQRSRAIRPGSRRMFFPTRMATSDMARIPFRKCCCTTRWSTRRYPGCSRSAMRTCTRTRRSSTASPRKSIPNRQPREILAELGRDHPAPDHLLQSFRDTFQGLIQFIQARHIVDIPSQVRPIVEETPPFMRATTTASMDTPGPFEKVATQAYFNVTLPGPHDTPRQIEERMAEFNRGTIISTAIHEAYPGHYIQFLWVPQAPSTVRKLLGANSNAEGWAHYCEQMMLDEGYGQPGTGARDARDAKMIRLGQLQDALLRDARFVVGIQMHTGQMTFDQAVDFFVTEGYQTHEGGLIETKRGTTDATYLYYTLGKLQIMKLRADMEKKEGAQFSLERFHDDFLKQGFAPIKIVRRALLGDASPTL